MREDEKTRGLGFGTSCVRQKMDEAKNGAVRYLDVSKAGGRGHGLGEGASGIGGAGHEPVGAGQAGG
jgi:hypothetical protein